MDCLRPLSPVPRGGQDGTFVSYTFITVETTRPKQDKSQHGVCTEPTADGGRCGCRGGWQGSSEWPQDASPSDDNVLKLSCGGGCTIVGNFTAHKLHVGKAATAGLSGRETGKREQHSPDQAGTKRGLGEPCPPYPHTCCDGQDGGPEWEGGSPQVTQHLGVGSRLTRNVSPFLLGQRQRGRATCCLPGRSPFRPRSPRASGSTAWAKADGTRVPVGVAPRLRGLCPVQKVT